MKNKITWLILSALTSVSIFASTAPTALASSDTPFDKVSGAYRDLNKNAWYMQSVYVMHENDYMLGDGGMFRPNDNISRGEFVAVLARINGADLTGYTISPFDDVDINVWYGKAVAWAKENGIVNGTTPDTFEPNAFITREEMCVMLMNYAEKEELKLRMNNGKKYADENKISEWAKESVGRCTESGLMAGFPEGNFQPKGNASRAESAKVFHSMLFRYGTPTSSSEGDSSQGSDPIFGFSYFGSLEDFYDYLNDMTDSVLENIKCKEIEYYGKVAKLTTDEIENGIIGDMRRTILESKKIYFPYVDGKPAEISVGYGDESSPGQYLTLEENGLGYRPWIEYSLTYNGESYYAGVDFMKYDSALIDEANEKGASWLISELDPNALNVYNYENQRAEFIKQGYNSFENLKVYEKEYAIGDRTVNAMVIDYGSEEHPTRTIYFVNEDVVARVDGTTENVEAILPRLTLQKIDFKR